MAISKIKGQIDSRSLSMELGVECELENKLKECEMGQMETSHVYGFRLEMFTVMICKRKTWDKIFYYILIRMNKKFP